MERVYRQSGLPATYRPLVRQIYPFRGRILDLYGEFHFPRTLPRPLVPQGGPLCCDSVRAGVGGIMVSAFLIYYLGRGCVRFSTLKRYPSFWNDSNT